GDEVVGLSQELVDLRRGQPCGDRLARAEVQRKALADRELVAQRALALDPGEHDPRPADAPEQGGGEPGLGGQVLQYRSGRGDQWAAGQVGVGSEDEPDAGSVAAGVAFDAAATFQHPRMRWVVATGSPARRAISL